MRLSLLALAAGTLLAGNAFAAQTSGSFNVTASVANSCKVTSTSDIAFGPYDPAVANFSTALDATGSVSVRCTRGTAADVALNEGANKGGASTCAAPLRRMSDGGTERLGYEIYLDAAHTTAWGCDAANDQPFTFAASNVPTTKTTYGSIPAGQDVAAGNFSDTVTVTVTF
ncbi:MAG TPA: spore coat U domain-containing protein [Lysobacter sp.]|nr:spore coat U domain-containing protein [Lysobacter sp.]